ncbi:MAG TPA: glycosyltransferase family 2 protein [Candidatus Saccharimonadales bacterium]|nr:glycosyltransferase family 2 protein [Candidatus Saccharimonadales bacterium]
MKHTTPVLSVVIPSYNEQGNVAAFYQQLTNELTKDKSLTYELIYVDDGSSDNTPEELQKLAKKDDRVRVITFSRNFGKEIATTAGVQYARGDATIIMDADGQHPADMIHVFLKKWRAGAQVVIGVRKKTQKEGFVSSTGSKLFYKIMNASADDVKLIPKSTDFRLIDKTAREEFNRFTERNRITRGLIDWVGYQKATVEFVANERMAGEATYGFMKKAKLGMNSFVSLSLAPLHLLIYAGLAITLLSIAAGIFIIIDDFILNQLNISGAFILGDFILFSVGLLLTSQGLIALYISHIHTEAQNRPLYIIDRSRSVGL